MIQLNKYLMDIIMMIQMKLWSKIIISWDNYYN
jgi:hypothetical protein